MVISVLFLVLRCRSLFDHYGERRAARRCRSCTTVHQAGSHHGPQPVHVRRLHMQVPVFFSQEEDATERSQADTYRTRNLSATDVAKSDKKTFTLRHKRCLRSRKQRVGRLATRRVPLPLQLLEVAEKWELCIRHTTASCRSTQRSAEQSVAESANREATADSVDVAAGDVCP